MAEYSYKGFSQSGQSVAGTLDAPDEHQALERLAVDGIPATKLTAGGGAGPRTVEKTGPAPTKSGRVPFAMRVLFVRELATFLRADIPLLEALGVLSRQEAHPGFQAILTDLYERIKRGESLSHTMARYPRVFNSILLSMVKVGETGGHLGPILEQMADWMEHEEEMQGEVRSALAYPLMLLGLGVITVIVLLTVVMPRISLLFAGMEAGLPLPTRMLMATGAFFAKWWWALALGTVATVAGLRWLARRPAVRWRLHAVELKLPVLGLLTVKSALSRFSRASAALLASGVPLIEALRVVRGLMTNIHLQAMIDNTIDRVTRGQSLAHTLEEYPLVPASVTHLLAVGERTGRLDEMFSRVAQTFERQTRAQIKVMLSLIAPTLIVFLAVIVAFIALSVLLPIFKMGQMV